MDGGVCCLNDGRVINTAYSSSYRIMDKDFTLCWRGLYQQDMLI